MRFGFQLYGAAKECRSNPKDFFEKVRAMGYQFIEPCIVFGTDDDVSSSKMWNEQEAEAFLAEAEQVGLRAFSVHAFAEDLQAELPSMKRLARQHQVAQFVTQCPSPVTKEVYSEFAAKCVEIADSLAQCGVELLLHNSSKEIEEKIDGKTGYEWLLEQCGGKVGAQPDTGWIFYGGEDPEKLLWKIAKYVRSLHHKDFRRTEDGLKEMVVGKGEVDTPACFQFGRAQGLPQFADMDGSENDMLENLDAMVHYLGSLSHYRADTDSILCSIHAESGEVKEFHRFPYIIEAPNWLADGSMYFNSEGNIFRYLPETDSVEKVNTGNCRTCNNDHVPSPDHLLLAVSEERDGSPSRIYVINPATGEEQLVTEHAPCYLHGWSPDGTELAYCASRDDKNGKTNVDIYTIPADGGKEVRHTFGDGFNDGPEFSPDGAHIWFNSTRTGTMQLWRMNRDGSEPTQMTFGEDNNWFGHVSPDGTKVVCLTYRKNELDPDEHLPNMNVKLQLMNYDGSDFHTLLEFFGGQGSINVNSWSPDSKEIAFVKYELKHK